MSWITSIHSHKEIIELIFHNFDTTQLPQSLEDVRVNSWGKLNHFEDPMLKLFVHQLFNLKKNMDETSMLHQLHGVSVVTRPSSSKNIEGVEIEEQDRDLKQQEREIRERLCVSIESEYEKIPDEICSGFLDKIQPRKKRKTEEERTVGKGKEAMFWDRDHLSFGTCAVVFIKIEALRYSACFAFICLFLTRFDSYPNFLSHVMQN